MYKKLYWALYRIADKVAQIGGKDYLGAYEEGVGNHFAHAGDNPLGTDFSMLWLHGSSLDDMGDDTPDEYNLYIARWYW